MQLVYSRLTYEVISWPRFFVKLREFVGEFRIEQQTVQDSINGIITISFTTDKVSFEDGKQREVCLIAHRTGLEVSSDGLVNESWEFKELKPVEY